MCLDCDFFFHSEMFDFYGIEFINVFFHDSGFYVIVRKILLFSVTKEFTTGCSSKTTMVYLLNA